MHIMEPEGIRREVISHELMKYHKSVKERKFSNKELERLESFSSDPFSSGKASWRGKKELERVSVDSHDISALKLALEKESAMRDEG